MERPATLAEFSDKVKRFSLDALVELNLRYDRGERNFFIQLSLDRSIIRGEVSLACLQLLFYNLVQPFIDEMNDVQAYSDYLGSDRTVSEPNQNVMVYRLTVA